MKNIMLDLETLSTAPNAVVKTIGAVRFGGGKLGERFYQRVDAGSCVKAGLQLDPVTVEWWLKQDDAARAEMTRPGAPLGSVLDIFAVFVGRRDVDVWGDGATFDNVILRSAYTALGRQPPWDWWRDRCFRTVRALNPNRKHRQEGTEHNALDDAVSQAKHLMRIFPKI